MLLDLSIDLDIVRPTARHTACYECKSLGHCKPADAEDIASMQCYVAVGKLYAIMQQQPCFQAAYTSVHQLKLLNF